MSKIKKNGRWVIASTGPARKEDFEDIDEFPPRNWNAPPPPVCFGRIDTIFGCFQDTEKAHNCAFTELCIIYRDFWLEKEAES